MWRGWTLLFVLGTGGLAGCGAGAAQRELAFADLEAQSARAEANREHARLVALEARLREMERRSADASRGCATTHDSAGDVAAARDRPQTQPLRSEGDFLTEARVARPASAAPAAAVALAAPPSAASVTERERLEQRLELLRPYAVDPQSGLSPERRDALRVLLRRDRQLDLMNPWNDR